ncbi:MAG: HDOD domain-containing protein [Deltaproteobacteria bacterium]|nr:HDOD domain-containing protein [Deltaproteobacteria bacterium]
MASPDTHKKRERLRASVEGILKVSTIPATLQRVFEVIEDDRSAMDDLVEVIERDPPLAGRIVGVANSAFYGMGRKVKNLPNAAVILGFNMIRNLAVSVSVFSSLTDEHGRLLKGLWRHSFKVALSASLIAERTGLAKKEDAFLAGLINDLGRVILYQLFRDEYMKVSEGGGAGIQQREEEAFGAPHTAVGAWFVDRYKFPRECVMSINFHHEPERCLSGGALARTHLVPLVYLAGFIVSEGKSGFEFDFSPSPSHAEIISSVCMDDAGLAGIKKTVVEMEFHPV